MPIHNSDVADIFNTVADLLEIKGENAFRIRAYRNAARTVAGLSQNVSDMVDQGAHLDELPGIGKDLAHKIAHIVKNGGFPLYDDLQRELSPELTRLMHLAGLGGKRVKTIHQKLGVSNLQQLEAAARNQQIRELPGMGAKTEGRILEEISREQQSRTRRMLAEAEQIADPLVDFLRSIEGVKDVAVAGSYRRRKETVRDLDILATCKRGSPIMDRFVGYDEAAQVISHGDTRSTIELRSGMHVDLRVVAQTSYGSALHYFTGSQAHNIAIRKMGVKRGLKINEYGVFKGDRRIGGTTEDEVYTAVGLPYIDPEMREDRGEIDAAQNSTLPRLITASDIRGDLHAHTKRTDGKYSLEEMVEAAKKHGYDYLGISDHSQRLSMTKGLDAAGLREQIRRIEKLREKTEGITILQSIEVDILDDGSLDLPDEILKRLDYTICSIHSKFNLSAKAQTQRVMRAMSNPYATILGHPTGRLINQREPYDIDMNRLIRAARDEGWFLEINAHPDRLDVSDIYCKAAKDAGVLLVVNTDAHTLSDLDNMRYGIDQARRGWLEADDVLNTRSTRDLKKLLGA